MTNSGNTSRECLKCNFINYAVDFRPDCVRGHKCIYLSDPCCQHLRYGGLVGGCPECIQDQLSKEARVKDPVSFNAVKIIAEEVIKNTTRSHVWAAARMAHYILSTRSLDDHEGMVLPGWTCPNCQGFNGSAIQELANCRACGFSRPILSSPPIEHDRGVPMNQEALEGTVMLQNQTDPANNGPWKASAKVEAICTGTMVHNEYEDSPAHLVHDEFTACPVHDYKGNK